MKKVILLTSAFLGFLVPEVQSSAIDSQSQQFSAEASLANSKRMLYRDNGLDYGRFVSFYDKIHGVESVRGYLKRIRAELETMGQQHGKVERGGFLSRYVSLHGAVARLSASQPNIGLLDEELVSAAVSLDNEFWKAERKFATDNRQRISQATLYARQLEKNPNDEMTQKLLDSVMSTLEAKDNESHAGLVKAVEAWLNDAEQKLSEQIAQLESDIAQAVELAATEHPAG